MATCSFRSHDSDPSSALRSALGFAALLTLIATAPLAATPAQRAVSPGPLIDVWVDSSAHDILPAVAYNAVHDEYLVVWVHSSPSRIYARRIAGDGTPLTWFVVSEGAGGVEEHQHPDVTFSPEQEEYLIAWERITFTPPSSSSVPVQARRVKWDGSAMSPVFPVIDDGGNHLDPALAYNHQNQEYLVAYNSNMSPTRGHLTVQRVGAGDGALLTWADVASGPVGATRSWPHLAYNATRNEILVVYRYRLATTYGIRAKVAPANLLGLSTGLEILVETDTSKEHWSPRTIAGPDEYLVLWGEEVSFSASRIYARRVGGDGTPHGPGSGFVLHEMDSLVLAGGEFIDLAYRPGFGYLAVWNAHVGATLENVLARAVLPGTDAPWGDLQVIEDVRGAPAVACVPDRDCLVPFEHAFPPETNVQIRARLVDIPIFADGFESGDTARW